MKTPIIIFLYNIVVFVSIYAQSNLQEVKSLQIRPNIYTSHKISQEIIIDGKLDSVWNTTQWSSNFVDIEGKHMPKPKYNTRFKMLWDENNLYIYARLEDPHIWGTLTKHDAIIYHDNDFELFIKPKLSSQVYYEIEVNALNTIMDLMLPKPYRFGGQALMHWDTKNLKSAIHIEGTLNNPKDTDSYWAVEMAIPFKSIQNFGSNPVPKINEYWRINFSRVQWQHDISNNKYTRKQENNKLFPENNWVWSPIGLINMHYPEKWGFIKFVDQLDNKELPPYFEIEQTIWNIYYLQQIYKNKNQEYTKELQLLEGYSELLKHKIPDYDVQITLSGDKKFFQIHLKEKYTAYFFSIDSHGNYTTNYE